MTILQPPGWARPKGYSNGLVARGTMVFVAGQVGWTPEGEFAETTLAGQARQALINIRTILAEAGAAPSHIVRMTWYLGDKEEYLAEQEHLGRIYREIIGRTFPVMTAIEVSGFIEPGAKVEIEATAVIPD